jgi:excisionase family DNA binding protein
VNLRDSEQDGKDRAIGEAADVLGVSIATLRRWEAAGKLAAEHMTGGHRRDDVAKLSYARNCSVTPTPRSRWQITR